MAPKTSKKKDPMAGMPADLRNAVQNIMSSYDRAEGRSDPADIVRHMQNQDPASLDALLSAVERMRASTNVSTVDFSRIPVKPNSFWVMQLMPFGFQKGTVVKDYFFEGSLPVFQFIIWLAWLKTSLDDENSSFRTCESPDEPGLPSSAWLLDSLKRAIASPMPPLKPSLPSLLLIALKLSPHVPALKPFLDSLPPPFTWRLETPEEAQEVADGVDIKNQEGVVKGLANAEMEKTLGNQAFAKKDRSIAVKHYTEAIECLQDAAAQNPTDTDMKKIKSLLSICLSNRAATWLLDGEGQDPKKALQDAEKSVAIDDKYAKAYHRQAKAYQLLSDKSSAIDALTGALRKPSLAADRGLNDTLVETYGGFLDSEDDLRRFCLRVFKDDGGDKRARGLKEFERRANLHIQKIIGPNASLDTL